MSPVVDRVTQTLGSPTILCILGSRMCFNLKEAGEHGVNVGTNWSSHSHTTIGFEEPTRDEVLLVIRSFTTLRIYAS